MRRWASERSAGYSSHPTTFQWKYCQNQDHFLPRLTRGEARAGVRPLSDDGGPRRAGRPVDDRHVRSLGGDLVEYYPAVHG